ncbi:MAG: response regulator [bacterium]
MAADILIVEDEMVVGLELRKTLDYLGYKTFDVVTEGSDAIECVENEDIGLIIMDVELDGDLDGIETTQKIHSQFSVPIVFLTSYSDGDTIKRMEDTGALGYIFKPFERDDLDKAIGYALSTDQKKTPSLSKGQLLARWLRGFLPPDGLIQPLGRRFRLGTI